MDGSGNGCLEVGAEDLARETVGFLGNSRGFWVAAWHVWPRDFQAATSLTPTTTSTCIQSIQSLELKDRSPHTGLCSDRHGTPSPYPRCSLQFVSAARCEAQQHLQLKDDRALKGLGRLEAHVQLPEILFYLCLAQHRPRQGFFRQRDGRLDELYRSPPDGEMGLGKGDEQGRRDHAHQPRRGPHLPREAVAPALERHRVPSHRHGWQVNRTAQAHAE